jgi:hypothetical protein
MNIKGQNGVEKLGPTHRKLEGFVEDRVQGFPVNLARER